MKTKYAYVYILASKPFGILYIGVTSDLIKRIYEHKHHVVEGFSNTYKTHILVYYEQGNSIGEAIVREKQLKKWNREWKINLITKSNPTWKDLYPELLL